MSDQRSVSTLPSSDIPEFAALDSDVIALEVLVMWGQHVLHAEHLAAGGAFWIGDPNAPGAHPAVNFTLELPAAIGTRLPITRMTAQGLELCIPAGAHCERLDSDGALAPGAALQSGTHQLPPGVHARIGYCGLTFLVRSTRAARPLGKEHTRAFQLRDHACTLGSLAFHAALLTLFAFLPPPSAALALDREHIEARFTDYLLAHPVPDLPVPPAAAHADVDSPPGDANAAVDPAPSPTPHRAPRATAPRPDRSSDPPLSRSDARAQARQAGIIQLLGSGPSGNDTTPYARSLLGTAPAGLDLVSFGPGFGAGNLLATGPGINGGASGSIAVGGITTRGGGWRDGAIATLRSRGSPVPSIRQPPHVSIQGALSKDVIRRTIQLRVAEVRFCYTQALLSRPDLQGKVTVQFVVGPSGEVRMAYGTPSDAALSEVARCIASHVQQWQFPAPPGGGMVSIHYPFVLQLTGG